MPTARALSVSIHVQLIHEIISTNLQKYCNSRNFKVTSLLNMRLGFLLGSVLEPITGVCISRKGGTGGDGWGHGYFAIILSGKNDGSQWSISRRAVWTLFSPAQEIILRFYLECTRSQQELMLTSLKRISLPAGLIDAVSLRIASLYLRSIDRSLPCHSKWQCSILTSVHYPFYVRLREVLHKVYIYSANPAELGFQKFSYSSELEEYGFSFSTKPSLSGPTLYTQACS